MAEQGRTASSSAKKPSTDQISEVIDLVKTYATQETVGPLKGMGRRLGLGLAGAFALSVGLFMVSLGLLRLVQAKVPHIGHGAWSWVPYLIVFVFCTLVTVFALSRISKIEKELD